MINTRLAYHETRRPKLSGCCVWREEILRSEESDWQTLAGIYIIITRHKQVRNKCDLNYKLYTISMQWNNTVGNLTDLRVSNSCRDLPPVISLSISLVLKTLRLFSHGWLDIMMAETDEEKWRSWAGLTAPSRCWSPATSPSCSHNRCSHRCCPE